jgi:hypothetical protein
MNLLSFDISSRGDHEKVSLIISKYFPFIQVNNCRVLWRAIEEEVIQIATRTTCRYQPVWVRMRRGAKCHSQRNSGVFKKLIGWKRKLN